MKKKKEKKWIRGPTEREKNEKKRDILPLQELKLPL